MLNKRGQGEQFNWIFVIVAGAVILGFFVMFTFKYIELQEKRQDVETVRFFGSGVLGASSKLQVGSGGAAIDSQGDGGLRFGYNVNLGYLCNEDDATILINGGENAYYELEDEIVFINEEVKVGAVTGLDLWILPWNFPFHITNFVYLANSKDKFYLIYDQNSNDFVNNEIEISSVFNLEKVQEQQIKLGSNTKIVFFTNQIPSASSIVSMKKNFENINFAHVSLSDKEIRFFEDNSWSGPAKYYSKEQLYGAIFSNDAENFECNINRSLDRVKVVAQIYSDKAKLLSQIDRRAGCQYTQIANALSQYAAGNFELQEAINEYNLAGGCLWVF